MNELKDKDIKVLCHGKSDKGKMRQENEDSFFISDDINLFIISDGMGGHAEGATASKLVADNLPAILKTKLGKLRSRNPRTIKAIIKKAIIETNLLVRIEGKQGEGHKDMGATVVLILAMSDRIYIANVGDSRCYRLRNGKLKQISTDHTVIEELIQSGKIEAEQSDNHPAQGIITQCVGYDARTLPAIKSFKYSKGDRLLLCSDGLTDVVNDNDIRSILLTEQEPQETCNVLVKAANEAGGPDNITVLVADLS
jgi:protein phosphatase